MSVKIFHLDADSNLIEKIIAEEAFIKDNNWVLTNVRVLKVVDNLFEVQKFENLKIYSIYNYDKINSLFKNFDTLSFLDLLFKNKKLRDNGYNKIFLNQSLHSMLSLPFFLLLMTALASTLTLNTLKKSDNFKFIIIGILITILMFYFKDLSLALAQTERIPLVLGVWAPIIVLTLFTFIGVLQINEK